MKITLSVLFSLMAIGISLAQSFSLPGDGKWYKVAVVGGHHGYLDYIYWHDTPYNPSISKGEIQFINSQNYSIQHHQTMGYSNWNQPQFALISFGGNSELWVKAADGTTGGTFKSNFAINVTLQNGSVTDTNLADNGGTVTIYDKQADNAHIFRGGIAVGTGSPRATLDVGSDISGATLGTVFGRMPEGNTSGEGTFLGVRGYGTQNSSYSGKSFALEHSFYGQTNSSVSFFRGGGTTGGFITFNTGTNQEQVRITTGGNVGIGTSSPGSFKLAVNGKIWGTEVQVAVNNPGPDYVFEKEYALPSLDYVKSYIDSNKHLPEVPSAKEMETNGINLSEMNMLLLKKVEELTLYVIEQKSTIEGQQREIEELKRLIKK